VGLSGVFWSRVVPRNSICSREEPRDASAVCFELRGRSARFEVARDRPLVDDGMEFSL